MSTPFPLGLRITAKQGGRRRAGIAHPAAATLHPAGRFTGDQVEALMADPVLVVEVMADEEEAAPLVPSGLSVETLLYLKDRILGDAPGVAAPVPTAASGAGDPPVPAGAAEAAGPVALPIAGDAGGASPAPMPEGEAGSVSPAPAAVAGPEEGAGQQPAAAVTAAATPAAGATAAPVVQPATKPKKPKA